MTSQISESRSRQKGVSSIEYSLIAALIAVAIVIGLTATGTENGGVWERWTTLVSEVLQ